MSSKKRTIIRFLLLLFSFISFGLYSCAKTEIDDLALYTVENSYGISKIKEFSIESYGQYDITRSQGATSFRDYIFILVEGGGSYSTSHLLVLSAADMEPIAFIDMGIKVHGNSLNFCNIYYEEGDTFPLLFVSNYYVYRIDITDDSWQASCVSRISSEIHAPTFAVDAERNILYMFNYSDNRSWNINRGTDKRNVIRAFDMTRYDFRQDVQILQDEAFAEYMLPTYIIGQDVFSYNGFLYWCTDELSYAQYSKYEGGIWVIDFNNEIIKTMIPYTRHLIGENEGIFFCDGNIYFTMRKKNSMILYKCAIFNNVENIENITSNMQESECY